MVRDDWMHRRCRPVCLENGAAGLFPPSDRLSSSPAEMPLSDTDVGIKERLGSHRPFRAVLKQTINDFVVNEVSQSGEVVTLRKLAQAPPPAAPDTPAKRTAPDAETPPVVSAAALSALDALFPDAAAGSVSASVTTALQSASSELVLPPTPDKALRKTIHGWVREHLSAYVTDTVEAGAAQAVRLRPRSACRPWKRRRAQGPSDAADARTFDPRETRAPRGAGDPPRVGPHTVVSFVLWKRHADTMDAISQLSRALRVPASAFSFAGTKDKRAVTTQRVTVRGVSEARFARANLALVARGRGRRGREMIAVGDVTALPKGARALGLGDLKGNRFTLALRDLEVRSEEDERNVMEAVESVRTRGFVNYFGLQRFGSGVSGTHETGFAFLRGDFEDVCRRILLPLVMEEWETTADGIRPERRRTVEALQSFADRKIKAKELRELLPRWMHIEKAIVDSFCHDESRGVVKYDYRAAFEKLPRNMRRMYGHAVQSYMWNIMASSRIKTSRPDDPSRMHAIEGDLVRVIEDAPGELNYSIKVRSVTAEEEQAKSVSVFRVLIPVLGSEVAIPATAYGDVARKVLTERKVDLQSRLGSEYGMKGTYRALLSKPTGVEMEIVSYSSFDEVLVPSSKDPMLMNPTQNPEQEKLEDGYKEQSHENAAGPPNANSEPEESGEQHEYIPKTQENDKGSPGEFRKAINGAETSKKALLISFTLGCGEYATMLIRELTGKDSAVANQRAMQTAVQESTKVVESTTEVPNVKPSLLEGSPVAS